MIAGLLIVVGMMIAGGAAVVGTVLAERGVKPPAAMAVCVACGAVAGLLAVGVAVAVQP